MKIQELLISTEPLCAIGLGVCGVFSTADRQSEEWPFRNYSMTGVSLFQGVRVEVSKMFSFQGIWNRGIPLYTEVSSFHGRSSTVYRGVLISGCWNRGVPLYTEVSSFQGVGIEEFHCIQRCPHFRVLE